MSTPCHTSSFLAVPIVSNQGSCTSIKWVLLSLFKSACVTALHLRMFTDAIKMGGCTTIRQGSFRQHPAGGMRVSNHMAACSPWLSLPGWEQCYLGLRGSY